MPLKIQFQGGRQAGQVQEFGDDRAEIVIGRDPERCQVCFPPDDRHVGREHCSIRRELGQYTLVTNGQNPVLVDGAKVHLSKHLPTDRESEIQLGSSGPVVLVRPSLAGTSQGAVLPPTDEHDDTGGLGTSLHNSQRTSRRGLIAAATTLLIGTVTAVIGTVYYRGLDVEVKHTKKEIDKAHGEIEQTQGELKVAQGDIKQSKSDLAKVTTKVDDLAQLTDEQKKSLDKLGAGVAGLSAEIEQLAPGMTAAVQRAMPSVYLVTVKMPDGVLRPFGTAFVVDQKRGILATNAHVGAAHRHLTVVQPQLPNDCPLVVRSPGKSPQDFEVDQVTIHPGYRSFSELWNRFDPSRPLGGKDVQHIASAGPACDVALLQVKNPEGLAPALKIADESALKELKPGTPLGLAGYPFEGLLLGGVVLEQPTPQLQLGYVTAVTDYFGSSDQVAERLLIQHSVPTAGGASGSPLMNARGEVVALHNASNVIGEIAHVRIGSPSNVHYGQRVDLIRELLAGEATQQQIARNSDWEQRIAQIYQPGRQLQAGWALNDTKSKLIQTLSAGGEFAVAEIKLETPALQRIAKEPTEGQATYRTTVELPAAGTYLFAVLGQSESPLSLIADFDGKTMHGFTPDEKQPIRMISLEAERDGRLEATVTGPAQGDLRFEAFQFVAKRQSADQLHEIQAQRWTESRLKSRLGKVRLEQVQETEGQLGSTALADKKLFTTQFKLDGKETGLYLVSAVSLNQHPLQLSVDGAAPGENLPGQEASWLSVQMERPVATPITGLVLGKTPGLGFSLRLYRAEPVVAEKTSVDKKAAAKK